VLGLSTKMSLRGTSELLLTGDEAYFERGVSARSGQGVRAKARTSDAADPSAVLPRWGKTSAPAKNVPRQDPLTLVSEKIGRH